MTFTPGISGTQPTFSESQHPSHHSTHMEKLFSPHIHSNSSFDLSNSISNFISFKVMSTSHLQHIPLSTTNYSSSFHLFFFFFRHKISFQMDKIFRILQVHKNSKLHKILSGQFFVTDKISGDVSPPQFPFSYKFTLIKFLFLFSNLFILNDFSIFRIFITDKIGFVSISK